MSPNDKSELHRFYDAGGVDLLFNNLPLDKNSTVIDVGGGSGYWAYNIFCRYSPKLLRIYEPDPRKCAQLTEAFRGAHPQIQIETAALGKHSEHLELFNYGDRSCIPLASKAHLKINAIPPLRVPVLDAYEALIQDGLIHLMELNCEGSEYDILDRLIDTDLIPRIQKLQIQFHDNQGALAILDHAERRSLIQRRLCNTHQQDFCFDYVWESWTLKP